MATRDISTKDSSGWMEVLEGQKSWTLSGEGLVVYNDAGKATPDDIYGHLSSRTVIYIEFGSEATDEKYYSGTGYFTEFSTDAGVEDNATFSFSFQGTSTLTQGTQA
jgi:predicted secreted protein